MKKIEDYIAALMNKVDGTFGEKMEFAHDHAVIEMLNDLASEVEKLKKSVKKTTNYCEGFTIGLQTRMSKIEKTCNLKLKQHD